jgi:predicted transcriptional regulator
MTTEENMATQEDNDMAAELVELAAEIVAAYVGNNAVPSNELPALIKDVYGALAEAVGGGAAAEQPAEELKPAVSVRRSVTDDYIVCLECGGKFKSLRRHLKSRHDLTPEEYRAKWGLPADYPMVAKNYREARSKLAREMGLGRRPGK